jgi:hypothetical protein
MKWVGSGLLAVALAWPAAFGQDKKDDTPPPAKDSKGEKKPASAREQYQALVKEFNDKRREMVPQINKAKGKEQQELLNKYFGFGQEYAEKFYQLAEDNPKDPAATEALFWVVQNGSGSPAYNKAADKVKGLIAEAPLKDLPARLAGLRGAPPAIVDAVLARAAKDETDPASGDLVAWVATTSFVPATRQKAIDRMLEKYPDHKSIEQIVMLLGRGGPDADAALRKILEKDPKPKVKAAATLALGRALAARTDQLGDKPAEADKVAAEAEKYLASAIELYADNARTKAEAERELKVLRTIRVGKEAPEIKGPDLDGKEFKLSDYRGKVVLLDFWGHW